MLGNCSATLTNCPPLQFGYTDLFGGCHKNDYNLPVSPPTECHYRLTDELVYEAVNLYEPCLAINSTFLSPGVSSAYLSGHYPGITNYSLIGYQQHADLYNNWTPQDFSAAINNGFVDGASFIELFYNTIAYFAGIPDPANLPHSYMEEEHDTIRCNTCPNIHCLPYRVIERSKDNYTLNIISTGTDIHIMNRGNVQSCHITVYDLLGKKSSREGNGNIPGDNVLLKDDLQLAPSLYLIKADVDYNTKTFKVFLR